MEFSRHFSRLFFLCLIPLVKAYTVFETTCSTPNSQLDFMFVLSPNTRGTLDILWSSLFTILACTWTLQHPNIPEQRIGRDPGRLGDLKWKLKGFYRSTLRMLCTVMAPELIIGAACGDLTSAHRSYKEMQELAASDNIVWTLTHSYYANMGGFVIRSKPNRDSNYHDPYHLDARAIYALRDKGHLPSLPDIAVEEIQDKSKGDALVKVIAVGQILWTVLQIIVRVARKLPVSPLEIAVVAFAVCAVIIYGMYWNKPQRVSTTHTVLDYSKEEKEIPEVVLKVLNEEDKRNSLLNNLLLIPNRSRLPGSAISIGSSPSDVDGGAISGIAALVGTAVFGGIHVIAWNFAFPTTVELIFWRCASVYSTAFPLYILFCLITIVELDIEEVFVGLFMLPFNCFYVVARLFILVEIFRTLCFLPAGSYVSTWSSNVPHVA